MGTPLTFAVLGPVEARLDGRAVDLGPARRRTTLAALLVDVDRIVPLDTLVDRIWDGQAPANPVPTVHAHISRLRAALRGADPAGTSPLLTASPGYRLALDPSTVDAVGFEAEVVAADSRHRAGDLAAAAAHARRAADAWRGDPYADVASGFADVEAGRLRGLFRTVEEIRFELALAEGRHAVVVDDLRALVDAEPLRERLQGALMLALYRSGRPAEALAAYERLRTWLADELGTDPGRDLQRLHQRVLQQDPTLDTPAAAVASTPAPPRVTDPAASRLVGRDRELERVRGAVTATWAGGRAETVAVVGEAGIGKTRLLDELVATTAPDVVVAWGRSWEHEGSPPLWPWVQALRDVVDAVGPDLAATALQGRAALVTTLDPALAAAGPAPVVVGALEDGEVRTFDAVAAFLAAVGAVRRVLVLLEDVHWSDPSSRRLVEYLAAQGGVRGVAVVVTARPLEGDGGPAGRELLGALARTGRVTRVDLAGLDVGAVRAYVADRTGTDLDTATADALAGRTGGNPFFVGELVRLVVTDRSSGIPAVTTEVPDSVREVVLRRVRRLSDDAQTVLHTAAVVGWTFDADLLREATGLAEDVVDDAVDRATAVGLLGGAPSAPGGHRFAHALVQEALLDDTGPARRRRLHARIGAALLARHGEDTTRDAERVVHHLAASGREEDLTRAVSLSVEAADAAHRRGAYAASEALLVGALEIAGRLPGDAGDRADTAARSRLASLYTLSYHADFAGYAAVRGRLEELVARVGSPRDVVASLQSAASQALYVCDHRGTSALAERMVALADDTGDDVARLGGVATRGLVHLYSGRPGPAVTDLAAAGDLAARVGPDVPVGLLTIPPEGIGPWLLVALAVAGRWDEARPQLDRADRMMRSSDAAVVANVTSQVAIAHAVRDDPAAAEPLAERGVRVAEDAGLAPVVTWMRPVLAWARARLGHAGPDDVRRGLAGLPDQRFVVLRPFAQGLAADVLLRTGAGADLGEAIALLDAAVDDARACGEEMVLADLHRQRALAWERQGRDPVAVAAERQRGVEVATTQQALGLLR